MLVDEALDYARLSFRRNMSVRPDLWRKWRETADVTGDVSALVLVSGPPAAGVCLECGELTPFEMLATVHSPCEECGAPAKPNAADVVWVAARAGAPLFQMAVQRVMDSDMAAPEGHITLVYSPHAWGRSWVNRLLGRGQNSQADDLYRLLIRVVLKTLSKSGMVVEVTGWDDDPIPGNVVADLALESVSVISK